MAFCTRCGLRLAPTHERCLHCGAPTRPGSQEHDAHTAMITMPPEHVLKRRKAFPMRDALYLPLHPEYTPTQQGARVIRKTHRLALSGFLMLCLMLLITVYNLFSTGFSAFQGLLVPIPGRSHVDITPIYHEMPLPMATFLSAAKAMQQPATLSSLPLPPAHSFIEKAKAREIIIRYYQSINAQDYYSAYLLWLHNPYDYPTFAAGFAHTEHVTITFGSITPQSPVLVRVLLTIHATERVFDNAITQLSLYQGMYLIQRQEDASWKIIAANFNRLS